MRCPDFTGENPSMQGCPVIRVPTLRGSIRKLSCKLSFYPEKDKALCIAGLIRMIQAAIILMSH